MGDHMQINMILSVLLKCCQLPTVAGGWLTGLANSSVSLYMAIDV
jgi:hypothetical protein